MFCGPDTCGSGHSLPQGAVIYLAVAAKWSFEDHDRSSTSIAGMMVSRARGSEWMNLSVRT